MKLDQRFITHVTKGEHFIISTGGTGFKGIIQNNETAAFIVDCLKEDTTISEIVDKILAEYCGVERVDAELDVAEIIDQLRSIGALEE